MARFCPPSVCVCSRLRREETARRQPNADGTPRLRSSQHASRRPHGRGAAASCAGHRDARHVLAEGLRPADDALPRRLRLLHVRAAAAARRARLPDRGRGARDRASRGGRLAAPRRSSRSATGPRRATASRARSSRRSDARRRSSTSPDARDAVLDETGLLPHLNPGVMSRDELVALRPVAASMGIMLETTAGAARRPGRPALGLARQGAGAPARDDAPRGRARDPVHERDPRRDRRDAGGADRRAARAARARRRARAPARGDRPELPREAGNADGRASRRDDRGAPLVDRRRADRARARRCTCRRRRTSPTTTSRSCSTRASTTGAASRPSRRTTSTPRRRGRTSSACARRAAPAGSSSRPRLPLYPEHVADLDRWADPAVAPAIRRAADAHGLAREDRWAPGEPVTVAVRRRAQPGAGRSSWARSWGRRSSCASSPPAVPSGSASSRRPTRCGARRAATR